MATKKKAKTFDRRSQRSTRTRSQARQRAAIPSNSTAAEGLVRLCAEIARVAADRINRRYLLDGEVDRAARELGRALTHDEIDVVEQKLARWERSTELINRVRRTGTLPQDEMAELQRRIDVLISAIDCRIHARWELAGPDEVETILLALHVASWHGSLEERLAQMRRRIQHAASAIYAAFRGDKPGLNVFNEPLKKLIPQLRIAANRVLGREDKENLEPKRPTDFIVQHWRSLIGESESGGFITDPPGKLSKLEALEVLRVHWEFPTSDAAVQFLYRAGEKKLPALRDRETGTRLDPPVAHRQTGRH